MATEKRLMYVEDFEKNLCHYCNTYLSEEPCEPKECWVHDVIAQTDIVDAVPVDKIKLHHVIIDNEGVPEVKLQIGDRYFLLQTDPVDVREVVHGHWISLTDCSNAGVYCSVCHKKVWKEDYAWCNRKNKLRSNYCPNCGAKMDGDGNG